MQAARNVAGHVQRKENEVQGLLKMHAMAASSQKAGQPVNWTSIKRAVLRSKPPLRGRHRLGELLGHEVRGG